MSPMHMEILLLIVGPMAVPLLVWFAWNGLSVHNKKIEAAVLDGIQRVTPKGLIHYNWLSKGSIDGRWLLIALNNESTAIVLAGATISGFASNPTAIKTSEIQVSEIISSEVVSKSKNGGIGAAVPVQIGDSSVLLGGLLNMKSESASLNIGLRNLQVPVVRIPMPDPQVAEEWHTRIKILTECGQTG